MYPLFFSFQFTSLCPIGSRFMHLIRTDSDSFLSMANTMTQWLTHFESSLMAQMVKYVLALQETWVQSLDQVNPLEKAMAIHSSILTYRIPWTDEPGRLQPMGSQRGEHHLATNFHDWVIFHCIYVPQLLYSFICKWTSTFAFVS